MIYYFQKMRRFLHISSAGHIITYDTFKPDMKLETGYRNSFIPDKSFYLSVVNSDGKSNWQHHCYSEGKMMDEWTHSTISYNYFDIDLEKLHIYIIDTEEELYKFFSSYGILSSKKFNEEYTLQYNEDCKTVDDCNLKISLIQRFIDDLNEEDKSYIQQHKTEIDMKTFHISEHTKFRENIICDDKIVIGVKGISINFASKLYSYLSYLISTRDLAIEKQNKYKEKYDLFIKSPDYLDVNYKKVRGDGFNGVYFTQKLYENRHTYVNIHLADFLKWLCCDTLIIWSFSNDEDKKLFFYQSFYH